MRDRLIEVEGEARDHGPGGEFGEIGAFGVGPLADAQELGGGGRLGTIMITCLHERAAEEGGFLIVGFAGEHAAEERLDPGGVATFT